MCIWQGKKSKINKNSSVWEYRTDICYQPSSSRHKAEVHQQILTTNMAVIASDGPWPLLPSLRLDLASHQPSKLHHAQSLLGTSFHNPRTLILKFTPRASSAFIHPRWQATTCCRHPLRPCCVPLSCSLRLLLSLEPCLLQFVSVACHHDSLQFNHRNPIFEPLGVFSSSFSAFAFLTEMCFSFKSLFAIWSLSPQRFH